MKDEILLTWSIPTYNRATKLANLLEQIYELCSVSNNTSKLAINISDNCSTDITQSVVRKYQKQFDAIGCRFKQHRNRSNIGMDLNYLNALSVPDTKYIWLFSDDDNLSDFNIDAFIKLIELHEPSVVNFPFGIEKKKKDMNVAEIRLHHEIITDRQKYPKIFKTKLSACILRADLIDISRYDIDKLNGSFWSYIPIVFSNLLRHNKLLYIYSELAFDETRFHTLRYDPTVFCNLYDMIEYAYEVEGFASSFKHSGLNKPNRLETDIHYWIKCSKGNVYLDSSTKQRLSDELMPNIRNIYKVLTSTKMTVALRYLHFIFFKKWEK